MKIRVVILAIVAVAVVAGVVVVAGRKQPSREDTRKSSSPSTPSTSVRPQLPAPGPPKPHTAELRDLVHGDARPSRSDTATVARNELAAGNFDAARTEAEAALAENVDDDAMVEVAAQAACGQGDGSGAQSYYERAKASQRIKIAIACDARGIKLTPPKPKSGLPNLEAKDKR